MTLFFDAVIPIGSRFDYGSKYGPVVFRLEAITPYRRKADGGKTAILTWLAECPQCGDPFTVTTGLKSNGWPAVRCGNCRLGRARRRRT